MKRSNSAAQFVFCCLMQQSAFAIDGAIEINDACAMLLGCFNGDTAGYPVTIDGSAGGSYILTSNLVVPDVNTSGIEVMASSISIDLNGFNITRTACVGAIQDCTPTVGSGSGIYVSNANNFGVTVRNGNITGMGLYGLDLQGPQAQVTGIRVRWNRLDGIRVGASALVKHSIATRNGQRGIIAGPGSIVVGNTSSLNQSQGIFAQLGSTVTGNIAYVNSGDGIGAQSGCNIRGNTVSLNNGFGLNLSSGAAYRENVINGNTAGTVSGGIDASRNSCNGTTFCP